MVTCTYIFKDQLPIHRVDGVIMCSYNQSHKFSRENKRTIGRSKFNSLISRLISPKFFAPHRHPPQFRARTRQGWFCQTYPPAHTEMVADALTKSLPSPAFISHRRVMMVQTPFG